MLRKFFSCCLVLLFLPIFLITLILFGLKTTVLTAEFYQNSFIKMDVYTQLVDKALPAMLNSSSENEKEKLSAEEQAKFVEIVKEALPKNWAEAQFKSITSAIFSYVKSETNRIDLKISLVEAKKILVQKLATVDAQNPASPEEINQVLSSIPDQFDLGENLMKDNTIVTARQTYHIIFLADWVGFILSILLLLILGLINLFYPPGMLKWLSIPVMVQSGMLLLIVIAGQMLATYYLTAFIQTAAEPIFRPLAQDGLKFLINPIFVAFEWESGIFFALGLITLIIAIILTRRFPEKREPQLDTKEIKK